MGTHELATEPEATEVELDAIACYAMLKSLAAWLAALPEGAQLQNKAGHVFVPAPHLCSQLLRMMLPVEGTA